MMNWQRSVSGLDLRSMVVTGVFLLSCVAARAGDDAKKTAESDVAIGGYCPVSYQTLSKAVKGDPAFAVEYQGLVYYCADSDAKKVFEVRPSKYAPKYGGLCTTALGGSYGNRMPSDPEIFYVIEGKLYLFSSLRARKAFDRWPNDYIAKADALYELPAINGYCPVSYQQAGKAVKGDAKFARTYRGAVYHFAEEEAAKAFEKDTKRFVPQYDGFCAEGMVREKSFPADPKLFEVINGKTYLFFDEAARKTFLSNPKEHTVKADAAWIEHEKAKAQEDKERIENYRKMPGEPRSQVEPSPTAQPSEPSPSKP